jgi:hypothetical protein
MQLALLDSVVYFMSLSTYLALSFFFLIAFPLSPLGLSGTFCGRLVLFSFLLFSGRHNTNTTTHNIHGRPIRPGIRTLLTSRWCRKSVALPSTTLPSAPDDIHTHPWPGGGSFLRKNPPLSVGFEPTSYLEALSPTAMRPPSYYLALSFEVL